MEIIIKGKPEEVAALVQAIQERQKGEITFTVDNQDFQKAMYDALTESES